MSIDFLINESTNDLLIEKGQIKTIDDPIHAVIRRVTTPPTGYTRMIRVNSNTFIINEKYGTSFSSMVSQSSLSSIDVIDTFTEAAAQDGRIEIYDTNANTDFNTLALEISYLRNDVTTDEVSNISINL